MSEDRIITSDFGLPSSDFPLNENDCLFNYRLSKQILLSLKADFGQIKSLLKCFSDY